jgi:hypothetical protein
MPLSSVIGSDRVFARQRVFVALLAAVLRLSI